MWFVRDRPVRPGGGKQPARSAVRRAGNVAWVWVDGTCFRAEKRAAAAATADDGKIRAPMTGKITEIRVRDGDAVAAGQEVLVLTAMKMEYALKSPRAGVIRDIRCAVGDVVDQGRELAAIEGGRDA